MDFYEQISAMYAHSQKSPVHDVHELRREAGRWLKELRKRRGLTQLQFAELVCIPYYTVISQIEVGRGRVPPDHYERWAAALGVDAAVFIKSLMRFYDPETYRLLFGPRHPGDESSAVPEAIGRPYASASCPSQTLGPGAV